MIHAADGPDGPVGAVVHPWDVAVGGDEPADAGLNRIRAPIASITPDGGRVRVRIGPLIAEVDAEAARTMELAPGRVVSATFAPAATRLVPLNAIGERHANGRRRWMTMEISARNQLPGTVTRVTLGAVMAEVALDVAGHEVVAAVTRSSVERMGLKEGDQVTAIIKATEVMIGR